MAHGDWFTRLVRATCPRRNRSELTRQKQSLPTPLIVSRGLVHTVTQGQPPLGSWWAVPTLLHFAYDRGNRVLALQNVSGTITPTERTLWNPQAVDEALASEELGTTYWMLTDEQDSVRNVVYKTGSHHAEHVTYDVFGDPDLSTATLSTRPGLYHIDEFAQGRTLDRDAELYYDGGRWYDPATQRFLSAADDGYDAGSLYLYRNYQSAPGDDEGFFDEVPWFRDWLAERSDTELFLGTLAAAIPTAIFAAPYVTSAVGASYFVTSTGVAAVQTGIEAGVANWMGSDYQFGTNFVKNVAFNLATANIGGVWETGGEFGMGMSVRYAGSFMGRAAAKRLGYAVGGMGTTYAVRKLAESTLDTAWDAGYYGNYNVGRNFAFNLGVNVAGDAVFRGLGAGVRYAGLHASGTVDSLTSGQRALLAKMIREARRPEFKAKAKMAGFTDDQIHALPRRLLEYGHAGRVAYTFSPVSSITSNDIRISRFGTRGHMVHEMGHLLDDIARPGLLARERFLTYTEIVTAERTASIVQLGSTGWRTTMVPHLAAIEAKTRLLSIATIASVGYASYSVYDAYWGTDH
mgnify:CR=1 FL=1